MSGPTKDEFDKMMGHNARDPHAHARIDALQEYLAKMLAHMDSAKGDSPEKITEVAKRILAGMRLDDDNIVIELGLDG